MVWVRIEIPEERTHLFEYGLVGVFIYQALCERARNGGRVPVPAIIAVILTTILGWVDEGIQWILPNRVYDWRDVGVNALAGLMAAGASVMLRWVRRRNDETARLRKLRSQ
jgi:VanZ family protein